MTQYTDNGVTNSQLIIASDKIKKFDEVEWIKTVEKIIREECPSGGGKFGLQTNVLKEKMDNDVNAVTVVCKAVNELNEILNDMAANFVTDSQLASFGSTKGVSELLQFQPGSPKKFLMQN